MSNRKVYLLGARPEGAILDQILEFALNSCDRALLVLREELPINERGVEFMRRLQHMRIQAAEGSEWPGTKLTGHRATIVTFRYDREFVSAFRSACDNLIHLQQPDLPEDLCLLRSGSEDALLTTVAHEGWVFLSLTGSEHGDLTARFPALAGVLSLDQAP